MSNSRNWTAIEDMALRQAGEAKYTREAAAALVNQASHRARTPRACAGRAHHLGFRFAVRLGFSSSGPKKDAPLDVREESLTRLQAVKADTAFQDAMLRAGAVVSVSHRPGTDNPRSIASAIVPIGGSSAGWGQ